MRIYFILLLITVFLFQLSQSNINLQQFPGKLLLPSNAYAAVNLCTQNGGRCFGDAKLCAAAGYPIVLNIGSWCSGNVQEFACCKQGCTVQTVCSGWTYPYNTCYNGNDYQTCTHTNLDCSTFSWNNYQTTDNCGGPRYTCVAATCVPWWGISGRVTDSLNGGGVGGIGVNAAGLGGRTNGGGYYGWAYALRDGCYTVSIGVPGDYIPTGPTAQGFCVGGDQVRDFTVTRVYSISGKVYDPANRKGIPGITVTVDRHTTRTNGAGDYTFPYTDHIVRGNYTVRIAVPACWDGLITTRDVRVGPDQRNIDLTMTKQYTIAGKVYDPYNGNAGKGGVDVHVIGKNTTTNGAGDYLFTCAFNIHAGTHAVSITVPAGFTNTTPTTRNARVGPNWNNNATGIDFGVTKLFNLSGDIFVDPNINKIKDAGENNYASTPRMSFTSRVLGVGGFTRPTLATNANGTYTITNVITGPVTVSYLSLPAGYYMTSPLNGPPPSFLVNIGFGCNVNGAPGASCFNGGDIQNLNFGIINDKPWFQSLCGDIRNDNGITDPVPLGFYALINNGTCPTVPVAFTGNTDTDFSQGTVSTTGQVIGGNNYPEVFSLAASAVSTSYTQLIAKQQNANIIPTALTSVTGCANLNACNLPNNLTHGIYTANGNVTITNNNYTFPNGANFVFLINGTLTLTGALHVPNGSTAIFSTARDIVVGQNVGVGPGSGATDLEGWFVAGRNFTVTSQNNNPLVRNCNDLRLNVGGTVVVNALGTGGAFQNNRDMCRFNAIDPTVQFQQRTDMILNAPQFLRQQQTISKELAP